MTQFPADMNMSNVEYLIFVNQRQTRNRKISVIMMISIVLSLCCLMVSAESVSLSNSKDIDDAIPKYVSSIVDVFDARIRQLEYLRQEDVRIIELLKLEIKNLEIGQNELEKEVDKLTSVIISIPTMNNSLQLNATDFFDSTTCTQCEKDNESVKDRDNKVITGRKGNKRIIGHTPSQSLGSLTTYTRVEVQDRRVAFFASVLNRVKPTSGQPILFEDVKTNIGGRFNGSSGHFTCQMPGTYVFMWDVSTEKGQWMATNLVKNGKAASSSATGERSGETGSSTSFDIIEVNQGDEISIEVVSFSPIAHISDTYSMFAGFILN